MVRARLLVFVWFLVLVAAVVVPALALADDNRITEAIATIRVLDRPGRDNLAAVWDGNKYVQCRQLSDHALRCEAGGALMQPSVLTPDRVAKLAATGWRLDPSFGNYVRTFPPDADAATIAIQITTALKDGYDADPSTLEVETTTIDSEPCPPRNGPTQNLAGLISDAPAMAATAIHACAYAPGAEAKTLAAGASAQDLIDLDGKIVAAELGRIRVNAHRDEVFVIFDTGVGYIQCQPETEPARFYCEAQSADSWPALAAVLTPDRVARLHAAGFADPGRAPNYAKTYLADQITDAALASEILTLLHDVYGYYGASPLEIKTEESDSADARAPPAPED